MANQHNRRSLFKKGSLLGLGTLAGFGSAKANICAYTPAQMEGPFYPVTRRDDENYDLTVVDGQEQRALGTVVVIEGRVVDAACRPLAGALVEIWQANDAGKYDHPEDDNPAPFDPNFQYWGRVTTGDTGTYRFKTIIPGLYPGRTRHIHFKIIADGYRSLTTQLYFAGEARNASDGVYRRLTPAQRQLVTCEPKVDPSTGLLTGNFDITLGRGSNPQLTPEID